MLRLFIYLYVRLSEQQAAKNPRRTRDFLLTQSELGGLVMRRAAENGCKIFSHDHATEITAEFETVIAELRKKDILELRDGYIRISDITKFNEAITSHPFAKFFFESAGDLFAIV